MQPARFSVSSLSIKHRLPLLIGTLLLGIILASTWASYRGVKDSALKVGQERLQNLTKQLLNLLEQSNAFMLAKTFSAANDPAIRGFLRSPSPEMRSAASAIMQQFSATEDPNSLRVELWDANHSIALTVPDGGAPEPVGLTAEFKACSVDPFRVSGPMSVVNDTIIAPSIAAVKDDLGQPIGYLVRWRRVAINPPPKQLTDLLGSEAALYFGNLRGDLLTNLERIVSKPQTDIGSTLEVMHYLRDGNQVMALSRPITGTPWFLLVEFPEQSLLTHAHVFLRRIVVIDIVLLIAGIIGAVALSRSITRPLNLLTGSASGISSGDYSGLIHIRRQDELGALGNAFNAMVHRLRGSQVDLEQKIKELKSAQESAAKLAAIVEYSDDAIIGKTLDGTITSWNKAAEKVYGYSAEEVLGRPIEILFPPDQPGEVATIFDSLRRGVGIEHLETERITKAGKRIFVSLTISPIRDDAGAIAGSSTIARDITARKDAEEALQNSEIRYRRLFESAKDGILILDAASGQILDVNPYLTGMLGFSKEQLAGKQLWEIGPFKDIVASKLAFEELQRRGYIRYENLPLESRDGQVRQVEFVSNSYLADKSRVIECNIRDITERKLAEEELRQTNQRLEGTLVELRTKTHELTSMTQQLWQASKLATMGELAASIAHELNNPLATLALHAESLLDRLPADDPKRRPVEVIEQEVDRMASLVSNLLLFSRRSHQQVSTVNVGEELQNSLEFIGYHLRSHRIAVATDFANELPCIQADRQQLRQLFLNLLTNASDAMAEGGSLMIRAKQYPSENGSPAVIFEFVDSGVGIQPEDMPKLWEPFFTTKPEGKGTGLGLLICRRIVEEHKGTIEIESAPGRGTTVRIILPAMGPGAITT